MLSKIKSLLSKFRKPKQLDPDHTGEFQVPEEGLETSPEDIPFEKNENALTFREKISYFFSNLKNKRPSGKSFSRGVGQVSNIKNLDLNQVNHYLFSSRYKNQIHQSFLMFYILLCAYTVGKMSAVILRGSQVAETEPRTASFNLDLSQELKTKDVDFIKTSNLFKTHSEEAKPGEGPSTPTICNKSQGKSNLPYKLVNTVVLQDTVKSVASVQVRSEVTSYREGETIENMARIEKIERLSLLVKNLQSGVCETIASDEDFVRPSPLNVLSKSASKNYLENKKKMVGIENEGNKFTIAKSLLADKLKNPADLLTQARGIQLTNPDGSISFKIVEIQPGGIFSHLGVQDNDIITHINGKKITDLNEIMNLFGRIQSLDNLQLTLNRNGEDLPLDYSFK